VLAICVTVTARLSPEPKKPPLAGRHSHFWMSFRISIMSISANAIAPNAPPLVHVFRERCEARAILVANYQMCLHDAVDGLWSAAEGYGLVALMGADFVQAVLADAFSALEDPSC
jgi:hypothetical protein